MSFRTLGDGDAPTGKFPKLVWILGRNLLSNDGVTEFDSTVAKREECESGKSGIWGSGCSEGAVPMLSSELELTGRDECTEC